MLSGGKLSADQAMVNYKSQGGELPVQERRVTLRVRRTDGASPFSEYHVPAQVHAGFSVYDLLHRIADEQDRTLAVPFFQCRKGVCTSCLMLINGRPRLACRVSVDSLLDGPDGTDGDPVVVVEPLEQAPVIKDLIVERSQHER